MSNQIFPTKKIANIAKKVGSGITPRGGSSIYRSSGPKLIRSQNVYPGRLILEDIACIPEDIHESMKATRVLGGDVLLNITGASIGRCAIAPSDLGEANVNQHVCIIRTKDNETDANYLMHYLNSYWGQDQINRFQAGGNREGLNFAQIRSMEVPQPPLPEQKKIAEILSGIDRLVDAKERRVKQKKLLLKSAFEDATNKSASDNFVPLSDLGRWRGGGTPSKSIPEYWGGTIPWVSPKDMKGRKISRSQDAITQEAVENSTTSLIPKDSILFVVRSGVLRHTFPIALATREVAINQDLKALTVGDYCNANFLLHYLCCRSEEILASCMKSGTTVESIDTNSLQNYQVPVISIREQLRLSLFAESISMAIEAEQLQVESLKMLKSSLSSDLLSGRKRVSI